MMYAGSLKKVLEAKGKTIPLAHQIEEVVNKYGYLISPLKVCSLLKLDSKMYQMEVNSAMVGMAKRGTLRREKLPSNDITWTKRNRVVWNYALSAKAAMPKCAAYIPYYERLGKIFSQMRREEKAVALVYRKQQIEARKVIMKLELEKQEKIKRERKIVVNTNDLLATQYSQYDLVNDIVESINAPYQYRDDLRSDLILHLLEGGLAKDLYKIAKAKKSEIYKMSAHSIFVTRLDEPVYDDQIDAFVNRLTSTCIIEQDPSEIIDKVYN